MTGPLSQKQAKLVRSLQIKKYREKEQLFWIEGVRLCEEALNASAKIEFCVLAQNFQENDRNQNLLKRILAQNIPTYQSQENFKSLADTDSPQGIGCVVKIEENLPNYETAKRLLFIDGIQDPGNMGTLFRTAEWFGFDGIITSDNSVDILNPKVLRSTMGAIFNIPVQDKAQPIEVVKQLKEKRFTLIGSVLSEHAKQEIQTPVDKACLVIGSEAHGIRKELLPLLDENICIPGSGKSESLNAAVAAGILMYTLGKNHG